MAVLPHTGASRYHNCRIDGSTSQEYFGFRFVLGGGSLRSRRDEDIKTEEKRERINNTAE
jgi:hypothetical protein